MLKNNKPQNVEKILPAKGDLSEKEKIMKLASNYSDPADAEIDISIDLMDAFKKQYKEMKEEGYSGSFLDFLKSEIALKNKYKAGGRVK